MNLIESYEHYKLNPKLSCDYYCDEGDIRYWARKRSYEEQLSTGKIAIYSIYIKPEFRQKGIFTNFINHIIDDNCYNVISILDPSTHGIFTFLDKYEYKGMKFKIENGDATLIVD